MFLILELFLPFSLFLFFYNLGLACIGQGSKLEKLASTGRFGLGFSSTYHLTDTPSFVTGDHLVVFDPHCSFAPGVNPNQPGVRIRFNGMHSYELMSSLL